MQDRPAIKTAIPKRRYQVGDHTASLQPLMEPLEPRLLLSADSGHCLRILYSLHQKYGRSISFGSP
jgi:hypothetical protein